MSIYKKKKPEDQTNEEWLDELNGKTNQSDVISPNFESPESKIKTNDFRYIDHRTTFVGFTSAALDFESVNGLLVATKFFNVKLKSSRGKSYSSGHRGQFIPPERSNFRHFWMRAVGKAPERWCRVHKSLRSQLKDLVFKCKYVVAKDRKNNPYFKILEIVEIKYTF